jgi:rare lipoprotein A
MVASAKPFVPEMSSPLRGSIRGDVPMPDERPYTLGNTQADMASVGATSDMTASRRRSTVERYEDRSRAGSYETRRNARSSDTPVAYAPPVYSSGPSGGQSVLFSGRGLY